MALDPVTSGINLVTSIISRVWPDKTEQEKRQLEAAMAADANMVKLLTSQMEVNAAEAANPNRTWVTWREMIGYACAAALWYAWILQPVVTFFMSVIGHPLDPKSLPELDITSFLIIAGGMLGVPLGGLVSDKLKGK